jgi:hypothetical protein
VGGLFLDVFIAFIVKLILRAKRSWGSSKWKLVKAKIDNSCVGGGWVMNCPTAEVGYAYEFNGMTYSVIDAQPFFMDSSAKYYVARRTRGETAFVRVNPDEPKRSGLRRADQPELKW